RGSGFVRAASPPSCPPGSRSAMRPGKRWRYGPGTCSSSWRFSPGPPISAGTRRKRWSKNPASSFGSLKMVLVAEGEVPAAGRKGGVLVAERGHRETKGPRLQPARHGEQARGPQRLVVV